MLQGNAPITFVQPQLLSSEHALKLFIFFVMLIILLTSILYFIKRFQLIQSKNDYFQIIGSQSLGGKDRLILVNICDKTFVLARNDQQITKLHCFDEMIESLPMMPQNHGFKSILSELLCRNKS